MATPSAMASKTTPASSKPKPKGILKQPTTTLPPSPPPAEETETANLTRAELLARNENAARIRLLQKLRDTQLKPPIPLSTFETLCQLPLSSSSSPASPAAAAAAAAPPASHPSPTDTHTFLSLLAGFQPSEYLDLIEERNCLGKCGYTLCGRARRAREGAFSISRAGGIAHTGDLNKWCSDACARRALHLKVQLDHPSYVRDERAGGGMVVKLELREEGGGGAAGGAGGDGGKKGAVGMLPGTRNAAPRGKEEDRNELAQAMAKLELDRQMNGKKSEAAMLAGERGDATGGLLAGVARVDVNIKESTTTGPVEPPGPPAKGSEFAIEGYTPKMFREVKGTGSAGAPVEGKSSKAAKKAADGADSAESDEDDDDDGDDDDFFTVRF